MYDSRRAQDISLPRDGFIAHRVVRRIIMEHIEIRLKCFLCMVGCFLNGTLYTDLVKLSTVLGKGKGLTLKLGRCAYFGYTTVRFLTGPW